MTISLNYYIEKAILANILSLIVKLTVYSASSSLFAQAQVNCG